ncbi:MAG TPA: hypothetical protein VMZ28_28470 [Kofleriaceae bacterium]|nr:hypothetical protein [Kofleriaceae bacterium]
MHLARSALLALACGSVLVAARDANADSGEPASFEWLRFNAGLGYQQVWLRTLMVDQDRLDARVVPEQLSGPAPAIGVSCKLWLVSLGVTTRLAHLSGAEQRADDEVMLWMLDGEVALRVPTGRLQPFVMLGGGYAALDDVDGINLRGGLGVDYYLTRDLSLRLDGTGDLLALGPSGVPSMESFERRTIDTRAEAQARAAESDGSTAGAALALNVGVGVTF